MTILFRRVRRRPVAGSAAAAALILGLVAVALQFSSAASARSTSSSCADPVTSAPTGPATVSAASTPYGRVLVVGSGDAFGLLSVPAHVGPAPCAYRLTLRV